MKREVMLVGGPADGKLVMVEDDQDRYLAVVSEGAVFRSLETVKETARSPVQVVYVPRRRGDYSWYQEGTR